MAMAMAVAVAVAVAMAMAMAMAHIQIVTLQTPEFQRYDSRFAVSQSENKQNTPNRNVGYFPLRKLNFLNGK